MKNNSIKKTDYIRPKCEVVAFELPAEAVLLITSPGSDGPSGSDLGDPTVNGAPSLNPFHDDDLHSSKDL